MRLRELLLLLAIPTTTFAQVSDADRLAARELYAKGDELQQQGKFAEALDKFQRSYETFGAPTTALHIAECQAALLHLVEAAETYRGVARLQLDDKSPDAFRKARDQAVAELAQVEPRIPHLTINVKPPNAPNLTVTVDGQPMKSALVGVARPIDPGTHKVTAVAQGYLQAEQTIDVKERTTPTVDLTLKSGGVTYTPTTNPTTNPPPTNNPPGTNPPGAYPPGTYPPGTYPPNTYPAGGYPPGAGYGPPQSGWSGAEWKPPPRDYSRLSLLFGVKLGFIGPTGDAEVGTSLSSGVGVGFGAGADVALRFARYFLIGGIIEGGGLGAPATGLSGGWTFDIGPYLGFISHPEGVGFYGELGGAYRMLNAAYAVPGSTSSGTTLSGGEFLLGLGIHIKAGPVRVIPKAQMFVGPFTNADPGGMILRNAPHFIFNLGATIAYDLDLDKPKAAAE